MHDAAVDADLMAEESMPEVSKKKRIKSKRSVSSSIMLFLVKIPDQLL